MMMRSTLHLASALLVLAAAACGGGAGSNTGSSTGPSAGDDGTGASAGAAAAGQASGSSGSGGASGNVAVASDIWVDGSAAASGSGTQSAPCRTIQEALDIAAHVSGSVKIHVRGGLEYHTDVALVLRAGVSLVVEGGLRATIRGGGACPEGGGSCAVFVSAGATLDGFVVINANGNGVVTASAGLAVLVNVQATACLGAGIVVLADADLTGVLCDHNGGDGLLIEGNGTVQVVAGVFDLNANFGIDVTAGATLRLQGGECNGNGAGGVLIDLSVAGHVCELVGLVAKLNGEANGSISIANGITVLGQASLRLRDCTLLQNGGSGLVFASSGSLDLGVTADLGANVFAGANADLNAHAGVCIAASLQLGSMAGNTWHSCPVDLVKVAGDCNSSLAVGDLVQADVSLGLSLSLSLPIDLGSCSCACQH